MHERAAWLCGGRLWLCTKALLSKFEKIKPAEGPLDATSIVLWIRMRMQCTGVCLCEDTLVVLVGVLRQLCQVQGEMFTSIVEVTPLSSTIWCI